VAEEEGGEKWDPVRKEEKKEDRGRRCFPMNSPTKRGGKRKKRRGEREDNSDSLGPRQKKKKGGGGFQGRRGKNATFLFASKKKNTQRNRHEFSCSGGRGEERGPLPEGGGKRRGPSSFSVPNARGKEKKKEKEESLLRARKVRKKKKKKRKGKPVERGKRGGRKVVSASLLPTEGKRKKTVRRDTAARTEEGEYEGRGRKERDLLSLIPWKKKGKKSTLF